MYRVAALLFAVLVAAPPAIAREPAPEDIRRAAHFAQRIQKVYEEGVALSLEMDGAEEYIDSFRYGEVDQTEFTAALDPFLDSMRGAVDDFRARYPRAPSPPAIGSPKHERSMAEFAQMVVDLGDQLDRQLGGLHRLRGAALAGDENAYDLATADSMALAGEMILAENLYMEGSLVAIKSDHPQQGLNKAIIGGNEAMIVALKVIEANYRGEDFDARKFALDVEDSLRSAGRAIIEGENAARRMLKNLEGKFAANQAERSGARFIGELVKAYGRAFAVERAILETERGLLDYLRAVNAGSEDSDTALDAMADFQVELEEQVSRRTEELNIRLEMAAEFARTLQTPRN